MKLRKELEGILGREKGQPSIKTREGKTCLVYNMFDGLSGKKIKITIEVVEEQERSK